MRFRLEDTPADIRLLRAYKRNWNANCDLYQKPRIGSRYDIEIDSRKKKILDKIIPYIKDNDYEGYVYVCFYFYIKNTTHLPYLNQLASNNVIGFYQKHKNDVLREFTESKVREFLFVKKIVSQAKEDFYSLNTAMQYFQNPLVFALLWKNRLVSSFVKDRRDLARMVYLVVSSYFLWPYAYTWLEQSKKEFEFAINLLERLYYGTAAQNYDRPYKVRHPRRIEE